MSDRSSVDPLTPDLIARPCIHCGDPLGKSGDCPSCRRAERPAWEADPPTWELIERTSPFCRMGYLAAELYRTCLPDAPPVPAGNDIRVTIARRWDGAMDEARAFARSACPGVGVTLEVLEAADSVFDLAFTISCGGGPVDLPALAAVSRQMLELARRAEWAWKTEPAPVSEPDRRSLAVG